MRKESGNFWKSSDENMIKQREKRDSEAEKLNCYKKPPKYGQKKRKDLFENPIRLHDISYAQIKRIMLKNQMNKNIL